MTGKSKLKKNLIYQTLYEIISTCIPLITSPYLARVLGAAQQGVFSYTQSIVNYFVLFSHLGIISYGTRTIAGCGADREKRTLVFWNIFAFQFLISIISLIGYGNYLVYICRENKFIAIIQGLYILGSLVNINWLFSGCEQFELTVKRNFFIRCISLVAIMTMVKSREDLWIYTVIMAGSTFLSNAVLWKFVNRLVDYNGLRKISKMRIRTHIKPILILFVPVIAGTVFHVMDKTMLGLLSTYEETGFYYNADKVINIPISIIGGISTVMLPRMSALVEMGEKKTSERLFNFSLEGIVLVSSAMAFGIAAVSKEFTPLFFGEGFEACIYLIMMLAPVLIIKSLSQTSRAQYLVPNHYEKIYIQSVFLGAAVNLCVNLMLISRFGAMGAVVGTLIAEAVTCFWQYFRMRRLIAYGKSMTRSMIYVLFGIVMFIVVRIVALLPVNNLVGLGLEIVIGGCVFTSMCLVYWIVSKNPLMAMVLSKRK